MTSSVSHKAQPETGDRQSKAYNKSSARSPSRRSRRLIPKNLKRGAYLQAFASLLWLPQAGFLAFAIGRLMDTGFDNSIYFDALAVFLIGCLRSLCDAKGAAKAFDTARAELTILREKAVQSLSHRSPLDMSRSSSGEAASMLAEQAEMIVPYLSRFVPVRVRVMLVPLAILLVVFWYSWIAALVLLVAAPLIPIFMALIGWRAKEASEKQLIALGGMNGFLLDRLRGLATIRSFDAVDVTAKRLRQDAETLRQKTMVVLRIAFLSSAVLELFAALGVAMVAVYIGFHLLGTLDFGAWGYKLTLAEGLFILMLAPAFFEPLRDLSAVWHDRASGEAAIDGLEKLSQFDAAIVGTLAQTKKHSIVPAIAFRDVSFQYTNGPSVLDHFNLDISAGEHVALLAPSGYGKSTILSLIAGLVAPQSGDIKIGNEAVNAENAAQLREGMSWVGQKPHIFSGSARYNISLGRNVTADRTAEIIDEMALSHVAGITGVGLIGESGSGLSGGEALRLALARIAVNRDANIILADEPTAHLDYETASRITDTLLALAQGKTLIVATHDQALAAKMHRIIRLDAFLDSRLTDSIDGKPRAAE